MLSKTVLWVRSQVVVSFLAFLFSPCALLGKSGVVVVNEVKHDQSPPLGQMTASPTQDGGDPKMRPLHLVRHQAKQGQIDPVVQSSEGSAASAETASALNGIGSGGWAPSDSNGAAGATQYVEWANNEFAVYDKATGALLQGPLAGNTLWSGFGGPCETTNDGDPIAQYDKAANRWVMAQLGNISFGPPYYECVAVSNTSDATGSYHRYAFAFSALNDYTKLSVWPDGYYLSANMFQNGNYAGPEACALNRQAMLAGTAATMQCFQPSNPGWTYSLLPSDLDGSTPPPAGSPNYYLCLGSDCGTPSGNYGTSSLNLWKFHVDWTTPGNSTFTGPTNIPVQTYNEGCAGGICIPQAGTSQQLDSLGDRLMYRVAYRNFGDHESLVLNHSVTTAGGVVGLRWYEIRNPGSSSPTVYQQQTFAPSDGNYRWMGSIAMDQAGDIALGYSVSGNNLHPAIRFTGRVPGDALGQMEAETSIIEGTGSQLTGLSRWGDYSSMSIDPVDDCTFWYVNQYIPSSGTYNWATQIHSFKFPSCGTATAAAPAAPTGLAAAAGNAQVSLSWNSSVGASSYTVLRSGASAGPFVQVAGGVTTTSYTDTAVSNGTTYYYVVQAVNSVGPSANSNQASAKPQAPTAPAAPTSLTASGARRRINLTWAQSTGVTQNRVYRSTTSGAGYALVGTVAATTSYTDSNLIRGQIYYYVVTAVNSAGASAYSNQSSATPR